MEPVTRCGPEEQRWREHVRSVAERHVAPLVREMDANARLDPLDLAVTTPVTLSL